MTGRVATRETSESSQTVVHPFSKLRHSGLLCLINETILHPLGYGLGLSYEFPRLDDSEPTGFVIYGNGTDERAFADGCVEERGDLAAFVGNPANRSVERSVSPEIVADRLRAEMAATDDEVRKAALGRRLLEMGL